MAVNPERIELARFDVRRIRRDFPALARKVHGHRLVYLDNAATTQKPNAVIDALTDYYRSYNANVHRGVHTLSELATERYESARRDLAGFIGASQAEEIIFLRGATEAINLVAGSWGMTNIGAGDEILLTELEHHSNIVPWQLLAERVGARIVVAPIDQQGNVVSETFFSALSERTRLVGIAQVSNALGTVNPVTEMIRSAHAAGARVLIDGAQAVGHMPVNVQELGCDFYALSGHKMYGPMGIGALYAKKDLLERMSPWQGGGDMIRAVNFTRSLYADPPQRFEAGTPNVAGAIGLAAAIEYLKALGMEAIAAHEKVLLDYALKRLTTVPGLKLIGTPGKRSGVISFWVEGIHPHDLGTLLDHAGVAIRTGHHCAMPVMEHFKVPATARASFGIYNTKEDVDALIAALNQAREIFGG